MDLFNSTAFGNHVDALLKEWHTPGLAIAVVQNDRIASRGFGRACIDPEKPVTADTLFDIASCSKSTTAGAVALLVEDEEHYPDIKWDAKMSALLPDDFVMAEESYMKDVTVEDILSHRTGLASHDLSYKHSDTPKSVTRNIRNLEITRPIRTGEQYCNMMYTVASHLVETFTKQSFRDFLTESIWKPLGMTSTHLQPGSAIAAGLKDRIITPYHWDPEAQKYNAAKLQQIPEAQGAGSIFTSVNDYILWIKAMVNQEAPITKEVFSGMVKPRILSNPDDDSAKLEPFKSPAMYAAGLQVEYYRGYQMISHSGGDPGVGSFLFFLPGKKFGGVLFGNSGDAGSVAYVLAHELVDAALGVPEAEREDWNARVHRDDDEYMAKRDDRWKEVLDIAVEGDMPESEPQTRPLDEYTGTYDNVGYHDIVVQIREGHLYIDATDRTMGFYLHLEHFRDQERYIAHSEDFYDGAKGKLAIKFSFENGSGRATGIGVDLEEDLDHLIWFDRVEEAKAKELPRR